MRIPWWKAYLRVAWACKTPFVICIDNYYDEVDIADVMRYIPEGEYVPETHDCDDFALVMNSYVAISFIKSTYDKQGAFMTLWSNTHAYNGFVDDKATWVYEPQNGRIIGKLGETGEPYDTRKVWFPGLKSS